MVRMSAEERRESVIRAAMSEFAQGGYYGTSTETIAKRVGVSQPYLFRLFPGKKAIFLAVAERCLRETREVFEKSSEGLHGLEAKHAMAEAYSRLIADQPEKLQMQLQVYVTVAAAEAAGEHEFGEMVRKGWLEIWDCVHLALGGDIEQTTNFLAYGMLINTLVGMGFQPGHRVYGAIQESGRYEPGQEDT